VFTWRPYKIDSYCVYVTLTMEVIGCLRRIAQDVVEKDIISVEQSQRSIDVRNAKVKRKYGNGKNKA
jgi:hypothetical protein